MIKNMMNKYKISQIQFQAKPTPLENKALLEELFDTLENLQKSELL